MRRAGLPGMGGGIGVEWGTGRPWAVQEGEEAERQGGYS